MTWKHSHECALALIPALLVVGCSALKPTTTLVAPSFAGIQGLIQTGNKTSLKWLAPVASADDYVYLIYQSSPDSLPKGGSLTNQIDGRQVFLYSGFSGSLPLSSGTQIGVVDKTVTSFDIPEILDQNKNYAYQVMAANKSNGMTDSNRVVIGVQGFGSVAYKGCLSAVGVDFQSIKVSFDAPEQASEITVMRDGQKVYDSTDPTVTSFVDANLTPGKTYQYTCAAQVGTKTLAGPAPVNSTTVDPLQSYKGCVAATALGADSVNVSFIAPKGADKVNIYRNGNITSTLALSAAQVASGDITSTIIDGSLQEGWTYTYTCAAVIGSYEHIGSANAVVTTLSSNPPTFAGITGVKVVSPHSVSLSWGSNSGVRAAQFKVYATPGRAVDYTSPAKIVPVGSLSTTVDSLGDELAYSFAVRACTQSNVCDTNTVVLTPPTTNGTMPDAGPPATPGITAVARVAGVVTVTAPWTPANGLVLFRRVAFYCDNLATDSSNFADYTNTQDFYVTDPLAVPVTLPLANMLPFQNKICHFIVQDYDQPMRSNSSMAVQNLNIGNLTPPVGFAGITSLTNPVTGDQQTSLNVGFTPIPVQSSSAPHGAYQYAIYLLKGTSGDACTAGVLQSTLTAATYPPPTPVVYRLTGLLPNTTYNACVRAVDSDGNVDPNDNQLSAATLVTTPPLFAGLQVATYNVAGVKVDLQWNSATPTILPIGNYYVRFHMNVADLNTAGYTQVALPTTNCSGAICSYSIIPANFPSSGVAAGGTLYAGVYACDNYNTVNVSAAANCTAITTLSTKQVTVPNLTPPPNFAGIYAANNSISGTRQNGVVQVSWAMNGCAPAACAWTSGYSGFKIYDLNGHIQPISVSCGANAQGLPDCSANPVYQYTLTGLGPNTSYRFFVTAFNSNFVETATSPSTALSAVGADTIAPVFPGAPSVANLTVGFNQGSRTIGLTWAAATDNQTTGTLTYNIFQQVQTGTSCAGITTSTITTPVTLTQSQTGSLMGASQVISQTSGGQVYAYRVTAVDAQGNTQTATDTACIYIPDLVPPVFSSLPSAGLSYQAGNSKHWAISWAASDNKTATGALTSKVYIATGTTSTPPTPSASLFTNGTDPNYLAPDQAMSNGLRSTQFSTVGQARYPDVSDYVGRDTSDITSDRWYFYLVVVFDSDGNYVYDTVPVFSSGFRVTAFTRPTGTTSGGKILVVEGSGFSATTSIYMGNPTNNKLCTPLGNNDSYFELSGRMTDADPSKVRQFIACTTPASGAGSVNIYAIDSGLQAVSQSVYTYYTPVGSASENPCDQPYGLQTTGSVSGANTSASPQIICNASQLALINQGACSATDNYISVMDNIYFGTAAWTPLPRSTTPTVLNGNQNFMIGLRPSNSSGGGALFGEFNAACTSNQTSLVKDLSMVRVQYLDANVTTANNLGAFAGSMRAGVTTLSNVHFQVLDLERTTHVGSLGGVTGDDTDTSSTFNMNNSTINLTFNAPGGADQCSGIEGYMRGPKFYDNDVFKIQTIPSANCGSTGGISGWSQVMTVTVTNSNVYANITKNGDNLGGLIGTTFNGTLIANNVKVYGKIASTGGYVGGLAGYIPSAPNVRNITSAATISGAYSVGGLIGKVEIAWTPTPTVSITNALVTGSVTSSSDNVGGAIGDAYIDSGNGFSSDPSIISISGFKLAKGATVSGVRYSTGGVIGWVQFNNVPNITVTAPVIEGVITGNNNTGGIFGGIKRQDNTTLGGTMVTVTQAAVTGSITGSTNVGGLVGTVANEESTNSADSVFVSFTDSYVATSVSGATNVGGLAGTFSSQGSKGPYYYALFHNAFARVAFPNMSSAVNVGRILGYTSNNLPDGQMSSVYYDGGYAPGTLVPGSVGYGSLQGLTGAALPTARFLASSNYTGWDFNSTWQLTNGTYPTLINNPE